MSTTTVTGTVIDPDGIAWANGTATFRLINTIPSVTPSVAGVPLTAAQQNFTINLDATGSFSTTVTDTSTIMPLSQWQVEFTSNTSALAQYLFKMPITGASQSLNPQIAAQIVAIRLQASPSTRAYSDTEILAPPPAGATYFNTTNVITRVWSGSGWANQGGGGSSGSVQQTRLSTIPGVVLDCNVIAGTKIGGGTPTDNTTVINNWLATAGGTPGNMTELIIDGGFACKGLVLPTAGYIKLTGVGFGAGLFVLPGSNADPINNGSFPFQPTGAAPATGGPIYLRNFYINGNRGNGTTGNSNSGNPRGTASYWYCNITIYNITGLYIEDMYLFDSPAYSIRLMNCNQVWIRDNILYNPNATAGFNNDGIHLDAPASDVFIENNLIVNNNSDDAIAVNQPEGYAGGVMDRIFIRGNSLVSVLHGLRIYGSGETTVGTVIFSDNYVLASEASFFLGVGTVGTGDYSGRYLFVSGCTFLISAFDAQSSIFNVQTNFGTIMMVDCNQLSPGFGIYTILLNSGTLSGFVFQNYIIYNTTSGNANANRVIYGGTGAGINKLVYDGLTVINETGHAYPVPNTLMETTFITISTIYIAQLDYASFGVFATVYTNIGNIYGPGFQPDANIKTETAAYTILPPDRTILGNTTTAGFAVTLPATAYAGQKHTIKNIGTANTLTITGTVDGAANPTLATLAVTTVEYDGTAWRKVG